MIRVRDLLNLYLEDINVELYDVNTAVCLFNGWGSLLPIEYRELIIESIDNPVFENEVTINVSIY